MHTGLKNFGVSYVTEESFIFLFKLIKAYNNENTKIPGGFLVLELHSNPPTDPSDINQIRFRNIRIHTANLKPSPPDDIFVVNTIPNNLSLQEKENGYSLLWDCKTTKGWIDAYKSKFPEKGWEIKDGELID